MLEIRQLMQLCRGSANEVSGRVKIESTLGNLSAHKVYVDEFGDVIIELDPIVDGEQPRRSKKVCYTRECPHLQSVL